MRTFDFMRAAGNFAVVFSLLSGSLIADEPDPGLVAPGAQVRKLGDGFVFTEGPAADAKGSVYFSDIPNNKIHFWSVESGTISVISDQSGASNGLSFSVDYPGGPLLICEGGNRRVTAMNPADKKITVLADNFEGKKLNSPNDCWPDPKGGIYFTDPRYGSEADLEQGGMHVYYIAKDRTVRRATNDLKRPNGIVGSPDGKKLYVADEGGHKIYVYAIADDASLKDKKEFAPQGSDGMTLDEKGNLYLTDEGVTIYNPEGKLLQKIKTPLGPANVCFAGKERKMLFITARSEVYGLDMTVKGQ